MTLSLLAVERRLQPDRDRFLADIEMAEAADQAEAVELAGLLLEAADQQHLLVEFEQFLLARLDSGDRRRAPPAGCAARNPRPARWSQAADVSALGNGLSLVAASLIRDIGSRARRGTQPDLPR